MSQNDSFEQFLASEMQALRTDVSTLIAGQATLTAEVANIKNGNKRAAQVWSGIGSAVAIGISMLLGKAHAQ